MIFASLFELFFAYFSFGSFSTLGTLSKHGTFKKHCFSRVKTLFWRNRLCRINLRISIFGGGIVPCFLLNFQVFWRVFRHRFSHRFLDAFFTKNRSKLTPKDVARAPPFSTFFEVAIFCSIFVDFEITFVAPLAPFGFILVPFWLKLGPFWYHVGPDFGYFAPSGVRFGSLWAKLTF